MVAMTFHPGPRNPWILEHLAGDSTIRREFILLDVHRLNHTILVQGRVEWKTIEDLNLFKEKENVHLWK